MTLRSQPPSTKRATRSRPRLDRLLIPLEWMHTVEVSEHDLAVKAVVMLDPSVLDHLVGDGTLVVAREVTPTTRAGLAESHERSQSHAACRLAVADQPGG